MKKVISILAVAFLATLVNAVTIKWDATTANGIDFTTPNGVVIKNANVATISFTISLFHIDALTDSSAASLATGTPSFGTKGGATDKFALGTAGQISGYDENDYFFFRAFATFDLNDGNGPQTYYMDIFNGGVYGAGWNTTKWAPEDVVTFLMKDGTYGGLGAAGDVGKWVVVPVPEPATATLALAGLALLFKRRK